MPRPDSSACTERRTKVLTTASCLGITPVNEVYLSEARIRSQRSPLGIKIVTVENLGRSVVLVWSEIGAQQPARLFRSMSAIGNQRPPADRPGRTPCCLITPSAQVGRKRKDGCRALRSQTRHRLYA